MDLAIVGIALRLPGGIASKDKFWDLLKGRKSTITRIPNSRYNVDKLYSAEMPLPLGKTNARDGSFFEDIKSFDADFFRISTHEARLMCPNQRFLLEVTNEVFQDAGIPAQALRGSRVGVYTAINPSDYRTLFCDDYTYLDEYFEIGSQTNVASNRISYFFDLKGPSVSVDTACSSAGYAIHMARLALANGDCEMALVNSSNISSSPNKHICFSKAGMLSPTGSMRPFDAGADGYVRGEGTGSLLVQPLETAVKEGRRIYAVIKNSFCNTAGKTPSITQPSSEAQYDLLRRAYEKLPAPVYIEAHGTGTPVGDPIEAKAIGKFASGTKGVQIGSVKANIGHTEASAMLFGVIKAALMLKEGILVPQANFDKPNPGIDFAELNLSIQQKEEKIKSANSLIGVSGFGSGGANAHVVLGRSPSRRAKKSAKGTFPCAVIPISAEGSVALTANVNQFKEAAGKSDRDKLAFALGNTRDHLRDRAVLIQEKIVTGKFVKSNPKIGFVFCGQGPQTAKTGRELYKAIPSFRATIDKCDKVFKKLSGRSLWKSVTDENVDDVDRAQPLIHFIQIALVDLLKSFGVHPSQVIGHSAGEVAALYAAGLLDIENAILISYSRSSAQKKVEGAGRMLPVQNLTAKLPESIQIAAYNDDKGIVLVGQEEVLAEFAKVNGIEPKFLRGRNAFHSSYQDPIEKEVKKFSAKVKYQKRSGDVQVFSPALSGRLSTTPKKDFWWENVRNPVRFFEACKEMKDVDILIEIAPHRVLAASLLQIHPDKTVLSFMRRDSASELEFFLENLAKLYASGVNLDFSNIGIEDPDFEAPFYIFNKREFWRESENSRRNRLQTGEGPVPTAASRQDVEQADQAPAVALSLEDEVINIVKSCLDRSEIELDRPLIDYGTDSILATQVTNLIKQKTGTQKLAQVEILAGLTLRQILAKVAEDGRSQSSDNPLKQVGRQDWNPIPLQSKMFLFVQEARPNASNISFALPIQGAVDSNILQACVDEIILRHEGLRAVNRKESNDYQQSLASNASVKIEHVKISETSPEKRQDGLREFATEQNRFAFDRFNGPMFKVALIDLGGDESILAMTFSHVTFDRWAVACFLHEIIDLYCAKKLSLPSLLPKIKIQPIDYAAWQKKTFESYPKSLEAELIKTFSGAPAPKIFADSPPGKDEDWGMSLIKRELTESEMSGLEQNASRAGRTLFSSMIAAFALAYGKHTGESLVSLATPAAGRDYPELVHSIGCYFFVLPIFVDLTKADSFEVLANQIFGQHQNGPPSLASYYYSLFHLKNRPRVSFNLLNVPAKASFKLPGTESRLEWPNIFYSKLDLPEVGLSVNHTPIVDFNETRTNIGLDFNFMHRIVNGTLVLSGWYRSSLEPHVSKIEAMIDDYFSNLRKASK